MSITPRTCERHNWTSWTTEMSTNDAGDPCYIFSHRCTICGLVETEAGAIVEPR